MPPGAHINWQFAGRGLLYFEINYRYYLREELDAEPLASAAATERG